MRSTCACVATLNLMRPTGDDTMKFMLAFNFSCARSPPLAPLFLVHTKDTRRSPGKHTYVFPNLNLELYSNVYQSTPTQKLRKLSSVTPPLAHTRATFLSLCSKIPSPACEEEHQTKHLFAAI